MKVTIVSGSGRPDSQSAKVGRFLEGIAKENDFEESYFLDLGATPLPIWSPEYLKAETSSGVSHEKIKNEIDLSDALIVITPEWHGMATAIIKNFFLYFSGGGVLDHKPALAVAVSAARSGAYPIAELRMSSYKNSHLCYIPEHLIVRNVGSVMNSSSPESDEDRYIQERSQFAIEVLREYAKALRSVRSSGIDFKSHTNGM